MHCTKCGKKYLSDSIYCTGCGSHLEQRINEIEDIKKVSTLWIWARRLGSISIIGLFIIIGAVSDLGNESILSNNDGISSFNSGDDVTAILEFSDAVESAYTDESKINSLINLAYVYQGTEEYQLSLDTFQEALLLADINSISYNLIQGEIALLNKKHDIAITYFREAYSQEPTDFQVNNSIGLFYLDLEEEAPEYYDPEKALTHLRNANKYDLEKSEISKQNLAIAYYFNDNFDQSISLLSTTDIEAFPYMAIWLGLAYLGNNDESNATYYFKQSIDLGADVPQEIYDYLY
jgi:tetratricopeptide (TPR) repeat protein